MRGLAYKRFQREKHIKRKENILRSCRKDNPPHSLNDKNNIFGKYILSDKEHCTGSYFPFYIVPSKGYLHKGKIHCSCPLCSAKTNKIPFIGTNKRIGKKNYRISDLKKVLRMNWDIHNNEKILRQ